MREYILKVTGAVLLYALGEMALPEGNIRKYALVILSLAVTLSFVSPVGVDIDFSDVLSCVPSVDTQDTFEEEIAREYKKRLEEKIEERTGAAAELTIGEDFKIEHVILSRDAGVGGIAYITSELGVDRNEIEIREN